MPPNFVRLDTTLPDVARLVTAMVQARNAVERRSWWRPRGEITAGRSDHGTLTANQIRRHCRQPIVLTIRPAIFDRSVLSLGVAVYLESLAEHSHQVCSFAGSSRVEKPDHRHCRLLRARCERPRHRRAAEKRYELAALRVEPAGLPRRAMSVADRPDRRFSAPSVCRRGVGKSLRHT